MRGLFFLLFIVFISCSGSTYNCGEIDRKYEKDGGYFFALALTSGKKDRSNIWRCIG